MIPDPDFETYSAMYERARDLERRKKVAEALDVYSDILRRFRPTGLSYYERPAILLEKQGRLEDALRVCDAALSNDRFYEPTLHAAQREFGHRRERLLRKLARAKRAKP